MNDEEFLRELDRRTELVNKQAQILLNNGFRVYDKRYQSRMVVVDINDLKLASEFKISEEIIIASRA